MCPLQLVNENLRHIQAHQTCCRVAGGTGHLQICSETHTSRDGPEFAEGVLLQLLLLLTRCDFAFPATVLLPDKRECAMCQSVKGASAETERTKASKHTSAT